jgi:tetratricopeptide (TPR) repeat protein
VIERPSGRLRHAAFFEALASLSESDAEWPATSAGLMVLRMVDGWLGEGSEAPQVSVWGLQGLRAAIDTIPRDQAVRSILTGIVDSVEGAQAPDIRPLAPRLMAYGRCLDHEARWPQAIDVYESTLAYIPTALDPHMVIDARMRLAHCFRVIGRFDDAASSYDRAKRTGTAAGDPVKVLHARVGEGTLAVARGNLPLAESILDEAIDAATAKGFDDIRGIALHGRAFVASARGQHEASARDLYDALGLTHSLPARDRILADLATSLTQLGALDAARDAFLVVAASGAEQYVRWAAMINLMEVGALQMNEPLADRYRCELLDEKLPPYLRAEYHYYSAVAYCAFGKFAEAQSALTRAIELAERHALNQLLFQTEDLRATVVQRLATHRCAPRNVSAIRDIVDAVAAMRELVAA